jgi:hypothetical protein
MSGSVYETVADCPRFGFSDLGFREIIGYPILESFFDSRVGYLEPQVV